MWELLLIKSSSLRFYVVLASVAVPVWGLLIMSGSFYYQHSEDIGNLGRIPAIFSAQDSLLRSVQALTNNVYDLKTDFEKVKEKLKEQGLIILNLPPNQISTAQYETYQTNP